MENIKLSLWHNLRRQCVTSVTLHITHLCPKQWVARHRNISLPHVVNPQRCLTNVIDAACCRRGGNITPQKWKVDFEMFIFDWLHNVDCLSWDLVAACGSGLVSSWCSKWLSSKPADLSKAVLYFCHEKLGETFKRKI